MLGVLLNAGTIIIGGLAGIVFKKAVSEKLADSLIKALSLIVFYIGLSGLLEGGNILVSVLSIGLGATLGTVADLDGKFTRFSEKLGSKINKKGEAGDFAKGFVNGTIIFCVGAFAIIAPLEAGLSGNLDLLITKSIMDGIFALIFAATMGIGIAISGVSVLLYQGFFFLTAAFAAPYLSDYVVNEINCVGSLLILALAFNLMGAANLKVMNYVPAVFFPILLCLFIK